MSPYIFDLIVVLLVLLSAGLGFLRGFCNEIFTIFGWIGAVLATVILTPFSRDFLRLHIHNKIIADLTTASIIFIVTMIVFSVISHYATRSLQASKLNAVDRSLGFAFGVLRGVLLLGLMFLLVAWMFAADNRPAFIQNARTRPLLEASAQMVQFILPGDAKIDIDGTMEGEQAVKDKQPAEPTHAAKSADDKPAAKAVDGAAKDETDLTQFQAPETKPAEPAASAPDKSETIPPSAAKDATP